VVQGGTSSASPVATTVSPSITPRVSESVAQPPVSPEEQIVPSIVIPELPQQVSVLSANIEKYKRGELELSGVFNLDPNSESYAADLCTQLNAHQAAFDADSRKKIEAYYKTKWQLYNSGHFFNTSLPQWIKDDNDFVLQFVEKYDQKNSDPYQLNERQSADHTFLEKFILAIFDKSGSITSYLPEKVDQQFLQSLYEKKPQIIAAILDKYGFAKKNELFNFFVSILDQHPAIASSILRYSIAECITPDLAKKLIEMNSDYYRKLPYGLKINLEVYMAYLHKLPIVTTTDINKRFLQNKAVQQAILEKNGFLLTRFKEWNVEDSEEVQAWAVAGKESAKAYFISNKCLLTCFNEYPDLKSDKAFLVDLLDVTHNLSLDHARNLYDSLEPLIKKDEEIALAFIKASSGRLFTHLPDEFKNDPAFVLKVLKLSSTADHTGWIFRYSGENAKADRGVLLAVAGRNGCEIKSYLKTSEDLEIALCAVCSNTQAYDELSLVMKRQVMYKMNEAAVKQRNLKGEKLTKAMGRITFINWEEVGRTIWGWGFPHIKFEEVKTLLGGDLEKFPLVWELYTDKMLVDHITSVLANNECAPEVKLKEIFMSSFEFKERMNQLKEKKIFEPLMPQISAAYENYTNQQKNS
jgi:hypothetical protein